jgi:hypothetical protein
MAYVITAPCIDVKDGSCTAACPVDCIYEGARMFYIHPDECINPSPESAGGRWRRAASSRSAGSWPGLSRTRMSGGFSVTSG